MTASAEWKKFLQTHVSDERHIERVDATTMTREEFVDKYVTQGKPVMLTGLMRGWRATQRESTDDVHAGTSTAAAAAAATEESVALWLSQPPAMTTRLVFKGLPLLVFFSLLSTIFGNKKLKCR